MTATRGNRFCSWIATSGLVALLASTPTANGQGYGADPFQPYNAQYRPYASPMGPASPEAGQGGPRLGRSGFGAANQFQEYLEGFSGPGTPYYRSSISSDFDAARRSYRPTQKAELTFEAAQKLVTRKYVAYLSERDPKKRAELLKEYRSSQKTMNRVISARPNSPSQLLNAASRRLGADFADAPDDNTNGEPRAKAGSAGRSSSTRSATENSSRIGPPPPISGLRRPARSAEADEPASNPSDVLDRARKLDRKAGDSGSAPSVTAPAPAARRRPAPPPISDSQP